MRDAAVSARPLAFCVQVAHGSWENATDPAAAVARTYEVARVADAAGIESLWANEDPDGWDAFALLGALAAVTSRVRLGPGVTNPYLRRPDLMAASVATLDRLTNGRAFLGLGRGQTEWYQHGLGIDVGKPLAVLAETFSLLRQWWTPPYRAAASPEAHFPVREWERGLGPIQAHPPIYLAAVGPRALALAGRLADGVLFNELASVHFMRRAIGEVRAAAVAAGRDPAEFAFLPAPGSW